MNELENLYKLLESKDENSVLLALEIAEGLCIDWGEKDYRAWAKIILDSNNNSFSSKLKHDFDLLDIIEYVHRQTAISLTLTADIKELPGHAERLLQLESISVKSDGNISPLALNAYLNPLCTEISFREQQLKTVPPELQQFAKLQKIDFSHNELEEIPDFIGNLTTLRSLHLQFNNLSFLPKTMMQMQELRTLWLAKNNFAVLPDWLSELKNLHTIYIFDNPLDKLQLETLRAKMPNTAFFDR